MIGDLIKRHEEAQAARQVNQEPIPDGVNRLRAANMHIVHLVLDNQDGYQLRTAIETAEAVGNELSSVRDKFRPVA